MRRSAGLTLVCLFLLSPRGAEAASFPPHLHFRSLSTARVTVHYHQGLEARARQAASLAEEILLRHEAHYGVKVGRVNLVVADVEDDPNGFATSVPYPLVNVRMAAPRGADDFGNYDDWLRLVLTHELAHIVHLDQAHGILRFGRKVMGRAPYLFLNFTTPGWMIEGLATYEETEGSAFGRGRNPDSLMIRRMAALEGHFLREDEAAPGLDRWPAGSGMYLFGEGLLRDLSDRYGPDTLPRLARVHSGRPLPYLDERTSRKVTGASFHAQWKVWRERSEHVFDEEAEAILARGVTESTPLTNLGVRQAGPRLSPDGARVAYTRRTLTRFRAIHVMRPDGTEDRRLVLRNGGSGLGWTPDGKSLVYDEPEIYKTFSTRYDLRVVELSSGRSRRITRGQRAREPDVSPDGESVVFVRQDSDRSELALVPISGGPARDLTRSAPGAQWSGPRFSPDGQFVAASRFLPDGWLDLVLVDAATGEVLESLTEDRAKDVEPTWTRDGTHLLFRSDRDGVSNLYALRLEDHALLRATNVVGGAFTPDVDAAGETVVFSSYASRGYDVHRAALDLAELPPADPFEDPYPAARPLPPPSDAPDRKYRPFPTALPRFWAPYGVLFGGDELRVGIATAGADPLLRHVYGADVRWGFETDRPSARVYYQYDRFRPTFSVSAQLDEDPEPEGRLRTREVTTRVSVPVVRTLRSSHAASLAWRRSREELFAPRSAQLDLGGLETAWTWTNARRYPYSISPVDGSRVRVAYVLEDPALGSDVTLGKLAADVRAYPRGLGENHVLAVMLAGGTTFGSPGFRRSYEVGGFPDGSLLDVAQTNMAVLRGYEDGAFFGRRFVSGSLEYRLPLGHPQRGVWSLPGFIRHLHAAAFVDAAHAWTDGFDIDDVKTAAGVTLGADLMVFHAVPLTITGGVAQGFASEGETRFYFRTGLSF